ncbi:MAG: nucleotide exchange factor GrpE [Alphaproteobacteria bacterium]|nr:nucleotide exchange factor GrpE [Alphaproteobacteria bacterium]
MTKKEKKAEQKEEAVLKNASAIVEEAEMPQQENSAEQLLEEIQKWKDLALRSQAEMENLRKRTQIDIEKAHKYAIVSFAKELLPVDDCLTGAINHAKTGIEKLEQEGNEECVTFLKNLLKGVEMTQKQLSTAFEHNTIQKMPSLGIVFDPNMHKVIQEIEDDSKEPGTIVQELQSGYTIAGDRVLREAMVIVSK